MATTTNVDEHFGSAYLMRFVAEARGEHNGQLQPPPPQSSAEHNGPLLRLDVSDGPAETPSLAQFVMDPALLGRSIAGGGLPATRHAVAAWHHVAPDEVLLAAGGTSLANHHAINALLLRGGKVLVEWPVYDCLEAAARVSRADNADAIGRDPQFRISRKPENNFQVDLGEWTHALAVHAPRLLLLSNPHNPSGVQLQNLPALLAAVDAHNATISDAHRHALVVVDEVYRELSVHAVPQAFPQSPYALSTLSLTKTLGLSGLRMGIVLGAARWLNVILQYQTASEVCVPALFDSLWLQAYTKKEALLQHAHTIQQKRLPAITAMLGDGGVSFVDPDGGSCILVKLPDNTNDAEFAAAIKKTRRVCVTPASLFGSCLRGYLRIAYMHRPEDEVMAAMRILIEEVALLKA